MPDYKPSELMSGAKIADDRYIYNGRYLVYRCTGAAGFWRWFDKQDHRNVGEWRESLPEALATLGAHLDAAKEDR
jgi:hypothetical protein